MGLPDTETNVPPPEVLDLSSCAREPIHIPGSIQPHGILFALTEPELTIVQVSDNTERWLGKSPAAFLNQPLSCLLSEHEIHTVRQCLLGDFEHINPLRVRIDTTEGDLHLHTIVHRSDDRVILEIELGRSPSEFEDVSYFDFYHQVKAPISAIQSADNFQTLCDRLVVSVRQITGFDRVMLYRFAADGAGEVIAEACDGELEPYVGLRYPESDIPEQARQLYLLNHLRSIPDVTYQPVALVPPLDRQTHSPLDLSHAVLRSVSPLHTEYLQNMGVTASMSISLVRDGKLWGLIACHHRQPRLIPYFIQTVCEFIGQIAAFELIAKSDLEDREYQIQLDRHKTAFFEAISQQTEVLVALTRSPNELLKLVGATGVAIVCADEYHRFGRTPDRELLPPLLAYLRPQLENEAIFHTLSLAQGYPAAQAYSDVASGLLALKISSSQNFYMIWFRAEVIQTVSWAGNPDKAVTISTDGEHRISPRKSFAAWQATVRDTALPWQACELDAAQELRNAIVNVALRHAAQLSELNSELERSNLDLDAFAYVASHDLKEPLRGIYNYSNFLLEDYQDILDADGVAKLQTLTRLTQRMQDLIDSLLHFSRLGRAELAWRSIDLNAVVTEIGELFKITAGDNVEIVVAEPLPQVRGDIIQIGELMTNLVGNAIKYNHSPVKRIEIGVVAANTAQTQRRQSPERAANTTIYVRDNGIGIEPTHFEEIFRIFKRLHARSDYGGGTGAGLTIAQKIVERHGGRIWVESTYGSGSTFYFTIPLAASASVEESGEA